jgi:putative acetyltransferase
MIEVRPEKASDWQVIHQITQQAFADKPFSDGDEPDLIDRLRKIGALTLSLVALDGNVQVGQITFSPAGIDSNTGPWYALGPVSVTPDRQGEGIGSLLIETGLTEITQQGALGCILTGNPIYYRRFGFELAPLHCPDNEPREHFMLKRLSAVEPTGRFAFHEPFYTNGESEASIR